MHFPVRTTAVLALLGLAGAVRPRPVGDHEQVLGPDPAQDLEVAAGDLGPAEHDQNDGCRGDCVLG